MLFTSGIFLFFYLPAALIGFFALGRVVGHRAAASFLAFMSCLFYGYWAPAYLALLFGSIGFNYLGGLLIYARRGTPAARLITAGWIVVDLLALGYFKYYNFFADNLRAAALPLPILNVVLPIGISFFTFTQIAFLVDTYKGKVREFRLVHYILFVTFFPHLIAGPILHHAEMMPQFADPAVYRARVKDLAAGLAFFLTGMAKKVLIADSISPMADAAFATAGTAHIAMLPAWVGALAYTLQLYFDFSGYSDMAVGLALLFGIRLPFNFDSPYRATSMIDFWRRWHMTLSRFLRDYLYIPLGGSRRGPARRHVNLFATMLLGGLWHGAAWTFVIWGALHGTYLIVNHGWRHLSERSGALALPPAAGWLLTMAAVVVGWVFFRAADVREAVAMLTGMGGLNGIGTVEADGVALLLGLLLVVVAIPNSQQLIDGRLMPWLEQLAARRSSVTVPLAMGGATATIVTLALIAASRTNSAFIYFNF
jgi:alginate O-acetyltransferase complex protein AlgI